MAEFRPVIRNAEPEDAAALSVVAIATFLESYAGIIDGAAIVRHCRERHDTEVYARCLEDPSHALHLAEIEPGAAPVGYTHLAPPDLPVDTRPDDLELKRVYALSSLHGTGLGAGLLDAAAGAARERGARRLLLGVYKGNARALGFYRKSGFETVGERDFDVGGKTYADWVLALRL